MKLNLPITFAAILAGTAVLAAAADLVNGIAALVGGSVITYEQVQREIARTIEDYRDRYSAQPDVLRQRVLEAQREGVDRLVQRRLILQEFDDMKVNLPESLIEDQVQSEMKRKFGSDRVVMTKTLQERGITAEAFRREIREGFIEAIMRHKNVPRDILVSPGRIEKFYRENEERFRINDQVRLRMIVVDKTKNPVNATRLAREIIAKLDEGADFGEMASVYSDGSQAREGGSWGWVERKVLRDDLAELAFKLPAGKRSDPIEKPEAVYIMFVEESRVAHVRAITDVREEIERTLIDTERRRLESQWIERLRKKSFVRYFSDR